MDLDDGNGECFPNCDSGRNIADIKENIVGQSFIRLDMTGCEHHYQKEQSD